MTRISPFEAMARLVLGDDYDARAVAMLAEKTRDEIAALPSLDQDHFDALFGVGIDFHERAPVRSYLDPDLSERRFVVPPALDLIEAPANSVAASEFGLTRALGVDLDVIGRLWSLGDKGQENARNVAKFVARKVGDDWPDSGTREYADRIEELWKPWTACLQSAEPDPAREPDDTDEQWRRKLNAWADSLTYRKLPQVKQLAAALWAAETSDEWTRRKRIQNLRKAPSARAEVYPQSVETVPAVVSKAAAGSTLHVAKASADGAILKPKLSGGGVAQVSIDFERGRQFRLALEGVSDLVSVMSILAREIGERATRDLMVACMEGWLARAPVGDPFWIFTSEHAEYQGLTGKNAAAEGAERLKELSHVSIEVKYSDGSGTLRRPLLTVTAEQTGRAGRALQVIPHPAFYRGIIGQGRYFWPTPIALLSAEKSAALDAEIIALGRQFRTGAIPARRTMKTIWESCGFAQRTKRTRQTDVGRRVENIYKTLRETGGYRFELSGGDWADPTAIVEVWPPDGVQTQLVRPTWVPSTCVELAEWVEGSNKSIDALAKDLDVTPRTIRRALRNAAEEDRPLPLGIRDALTAYLWGGGVDI